MGYADWHFMMKDMKENPKGFLVGLVVIIILIGLFFLFKSLDNHKRRIEEAQKNIPHELLFSAIAKKTLKRKEILEAEQNQTMADIYSKLDSVITITPEHIKMYGEDYTAEIEKKFNIMRENYALFLRIDDNTYTNLRLKKCIDKQEPTKDKFIRNPYFDTIRFLKGESGTKGIPTTTSIKSKVEKCANFK
ncbi:hypothetical protein LS74_010555 [Helicobacter magdeburgensis]|uniref:Uncharacterized protein n=1 Tax=Helicobacter magdeburgensis TaxID=471858 RepID=A0A4U8SVY9_9HELI|nr:MULTISPECIES: hypothetical protein [Helicobacter]TLD91051.1 hypothetical protein LS74_010555 [Helicobacter magdeburgensis]BDB64157.1 hypothetical protein T36_0604 [Helicobacter cinaedi]